MSISYLQLRLLRVKPFFGIGDREELDCCRITRYLYILTWTNTLGLAMAFFRGVFPFFFFCIYLMTNSRMYHILTYLFEEL